MDSFEFNKVFAAVLCAGITAWLGWFVAGKFVHPHKLKEDAVAIEGVEVVAEPSLREYPSYDGKTKIRVMMSTVYDPDGFLVEYNQLLDDI